jgi:hypothetical protein
MQERGTGPASEGEKGCSAASLIVAQVQVNIPLWLLQQLAERPLQADPDAELMPYLFEM